jgi:hypothetical protein
MGKFLAEGCQKLVESANHVVESGLKEGNIALNHVKGQLACHLGKPLNHCQSHCVDHCINLLVGKLADDFFLGLL